MGPKRPHAVPIGLKRLEHFRSQGIDWDSYIIIILGPLGTFLIPAWDCKSGFKIAIKKKNKVSYVVCPTWRISNDMIVWNWADFVEYMKIKIFSLKNFHTFLKKLYYFLSKYKMVCIWERQCGLGCVKTEKIYSPNHHPSKFRTSSLSAPVSSINSFSRNTVLSVPSPITFFICFFLSSLNLEYQIGHFTERTKSKRKANNKSSRKPHWI